MDRTATRRVISIGLSMGLALAGLTGCSSVSKETTKPDNTVVISRSNDPHAETLVRAYSLRGVGLKDAPPEEIQTFMETVRNMVVSKSWGRSGSAVQIFGVLMTVRTTAGNHLMIERYLNEVRQVLQKQPLTMGPPIQ